MAEPASVSWVKYRAQEVLIRLLGFSLRAEIAHRRLCDAVWCSGRWPDSDPETAAKFCRLPLSSWPKTLVELRKLGWIPDGPVLRNPAVGKVRRQAERLRSNAIRRGRAGAAVTNRVHQCVRAADVPQSNRGAGTEVPQRSDVKRKSTVQAIKGAERSTLSLSARKASNGAAEKRFLEEVTAVLALASPVVARRELDNWGGWWRNRFRENPSKAHTVIAEIRSMIKEGRVHENPGAAAMDLWGRLP